MTNLYQIFEERFPKDLQQCFIETQDGRNYSYDDLGNTTSAIANTLILSGVTKGDRVIVQVNKTPEAVFVYLACIKIGAILVPLNISYTSSELSYFLDDIEPKVVVCDPSSPMITEDLLSSRDNTTLLMLDSLGKGTLMDNAYKNNEPEYTDWANL